MKYIKLSKYIVIFYGLLCFSCKNNVENSKNSDMNFFKRIFGKNSNDGTKNENDSTIHIGSNQVKFQNITFDNFNFKLAENKTTSITWLCDNFPIEFSAFYFNIPPDINKPELIDQIREKYRNEIANEANGGIIKAEKILIQNIPAIETLFKIPQQPSGITYIYSIIIPFKDRSYVLKLISIEPGTTGMKEAVLSEKIAKQKNIDLLELMKVWQSDPYKSDFKLGNRMNLAEEEKYDEMFPFHPLSVLRKILIPKLKNSVKLDDELLKLEML